MPHKLYTLKTRWAGCWAQCLIVITLPNIEILLQQFGIMGSADKYTSIPLSRWETISKTQLATFNITCIMAQLISRWWKAWKRMPGPHCPISEGVWPKITFVHFLHRHSPTCCVPPAVCSSPFFMILSPATWSATNDKAVTKISNSDPACKLEAKPPPSMITFMEHYLLPKVWHHPFFKYSNLVFRTNTGPYISQPTCPTVKKIQLSLPHNLSSMLVSLTNIYFHWSLPMLFCNSQQMLLHSNVTCRMHFRYPQIRNRCSGRFYEDWYVHWKLRTR